MNLESFILNIHTILIIIHAYVLIHSFQLRTFKIGAHWQINVLYPIGTVSVSMWTKVAVNK